MTLEIVESGNPNVSNGAEDMVEALCKLVGADGLEVSDAMFKDCIEAVQYIEACSENPMNRSSFISLFRLLDAAADAMRYLTTVDEMKEYGLF